MNCWVPKLSLPCKIIILVAKHQNFDEPWRQILQIFQKMYELLIYKSFFCVMCIRKWHKRVWCRKAEHLILLFFLLPGTKRINPWNLSCLMMQRNSPRTAITRWRSCRLSQLEFFQFIQFFIFLVFLLFIINVCKSSQRLCRFCMVSDCSC